MPRKDWKKKEIKAGVPILTDKEMKDVAAVIEVELGDRKASKHDIATWLIHWFLTQEPKQQLKIARAGKAIEESLAPKEGNPAPDSSRRGRTGSTRVWTNRIKGARDDDPERFDGHGKPAREVSDSPVGK